MPPTPQYAWPLLRRRYGVELVVKHENHTPIGAFKVRGGLTYLHRLRHERVQAKGVVSATRGNHGQSLAFGDDAKAILAALKPGGPDGGVPRSLGCHIRLTLDLELSA